MLRRQFARRSTRVGKDVVNFRPTDLANLWLWLVPDNNTITTVSGKISQWNDSGGAGHNVTQGTAANRPTLSTDARGRSYAAYTAGGAMELSTAATFAGTPYTYFAVCFTSALVATTQVLFDAGSGGGASDFVNIAASSLFLEQSNNVSNAIGSFAVTANTNLIISASSDSPGNGTLFFSPNTNQTGAVGTQNTVGVFNVGNLNGSTTDSWGGGIYEVIVYNALLTPGQQAQVRTYLASKYGIATS